MEMNLGGIKFEVSESDAFETKTIIVAAGHSASMRMSAARREFDGLVDVSYSTIKDRCHIKVSGKHVNVKAYQEKLDMLGVRMYSK